MTNLVTLLYWWPKKPLRSLKTKSLNSCQTITSEVLRWKISRQKWTDSTKTPKNWKVSANMRAQLQSILKETESESEITIKGKQTTLEMTGHCCSGGCISRTREHEAGLTCQRHSVSPWGVWGIWRTYLWWLRGAPSRLKLHLQLLKMIRLVKSRDKREASEGWAKAN